MAFEQSSSFYQSSSDASVGFDAAANELEQGNYSTFESSSAGGYGFDSGAGSVFQADSSSFGFATGEESATADAFVSGNSINTSSLEQQASSGAVTTSYAADAQGIFQDPNPKIIRRAAAGGPRSYVQRVLVRFLQPPPLPPPGPLIVKEVRPPQPPPPPPLYIRQRPPPPPVLPPLVIREAPPKMPPPVPPQVITKTLPPLPIPPRSVIIERLAPLPPKPRDIIVERWLPYRVQHKRKIIIQRAPPPPVQKPRNIIIYYEPPKAQVVRRFLNLGVTRANPNEYVARYGTQLEDTQSLIQRARQVGVVEDITPPLDAVSSAFQSASYENYQSGNGVSGAVNVVSGSAGAFESSAEVSSGAESSLGVIGAGGLSSNSFSYGLVDGGASGNFESSSYEVSSTSFDESGASNGITFGDNLNGFSSYQSYSTA